MRRSVAAALLLLVSLLHGSAFGWGPNGHQIIGAIADERLAGSPAGKTVRQLLDGFTLEKASVIPDEIRGWDKKGPDDPGIFHYSSRPRMDAQLVAFWKANPPTEHRSDPATPSHTWFHYTDVPVPGAKRYRDGKIGRREWDIVHMMRHCIAVLEGSEPEENARAITKPIAIILLAHYVGDVHQPLHVGARYFNERGEIVDPEKVQPAYDTNGANTIMLRHSPALAARLGSRRSKLHGFWDNHAVALNLPDLSLLVDKKERRARMEEARDNFARDCVKQEPAGWRMPAELRPNDYPEAWAD
ncbi:MAG TPA: S1/P1 nuclease, partial [Chthoniobacterales bacterium]|nr:S1/P1 nuclease [Chthoniobacterales bacterium]